MSCGDIFMYVELQAVYPFITYKLDLAQAQWFWANCMLTC